MDWAIEQGANAVEVDLQIASTGALRRFYHGPPCDCTCKCIPPFWAKCRMDDTLVCSALLEDTNVRSPCKAQSQVEEMLRHLATKSELALVYIDSKLGAIRTATKETAAANVVDALVDLLFDQGYGGNVVVGGDTEGEFPYLRSVVEEANRSAYSDKIFIDYVAGINDPAKVLTALHTLPTTNLVYGTGITSCSPISLVQDDTRLLMAINSARDVVSMTYMWTVDDMSDLERDLCYVQGIITNYPSRVRDLASAMGRPLADQSTVLPAATNSDVIASTANYTCNCVYRPILSGCAIDQAAPVGLACKCQRMGMLRCVGKVVLCRDPQSIFCQTPGTSYFSCLQGRGNCDGYILS